MLYCIINICGYIPCCYDVDHSWEKSGLIFWIELRMLMEIDNSRTSNAPKSTLQSPKNFQVGTNPIAISTIPQETTKKESQRVTPILRNNRLLGSWLHRPREFCIKFSCARIQKWRTHKMI